MAGVTRTRERLKIVDRSLKGKEEMMGGACLIFKWFTDDRWFG